MKTVQEVQKLLIGLAQTTLIGKLPERIVQLQQDSRQVAEGDVFFAIRGTQVDGHRFISAAYEQGAALVIGEAPPEDLLIPPERAYLQVPDAAEAMGQIAHRYYGKPSEQFDLVGVTGTNGKTTVVTLLFQLFLELGYNTGLISTIQNQINDNILPSTHTTPDTLSLHKLLAQMLAARCTHVFMEVSSHAVVQRRIAGANFRGAVFTNISHDHLDFHKTFANYIKAKKKFFDDLPPTAFALVNKDDKRGSVMVQNTQARVHTFAQKLFGDYQVRVLENSLNGLHLTIREEEFLARLVGNFNAYNLGVVYAVADLLGESPATFLPLLSGLKGVAGRLEQVAAPDFYAFVDYAHTPDALENVLKTLSNLRETPSQRILTVVGCGGNRDREKRPKMAAIAEKYSDRLFLTSDNPRGEDPMTILHEMEAGLSVLGRGKVETLPDRREAIRKAVQVAQKGDLILVAGKGHETYQETKGVRHPFDDRLELRRCIAEKENHA